jgi:antirestriction protein ArdC/flagellar motor protein MotB
MTEKNEQEKMAAERQVELLSSALDKAVENGGVWLNSKGKTAPQFYKKSVTISPFNAIVLGLHSDQNGYKTNEYTLFSEAKKRGESVQTKEKGVPFLWYNWSEYVNRHNPEDVISRNDYLKLPKETQNLYKGIRSREIRTLFNIQQTTLPLVDKDGYEKEVKMHGGTVDRGEPGKQQRSLQIAVNQFLLNMRDNLVAVRKDASGVAHYDTEKDVVFMPVQKNYEHYEDYVRDMVKQIVSATGHQQRLAREGMTMNGRQPSEDARKQEQLVVELTAGAKLQELGIPAKLSQDSLKMIDYWKRELHENPCLIDALEMDVNNSLDAIHKAERGEKVEYATTETRHQTEEIRNMLPKHYYVADEIKPLPNKDTKEIVLVRDKEGKSVDVVLPAGASLEPKNELPGISKDRIRNALEKEGLVNVRFYNPDGALGFRPDDSYFNGKEVSVARLHGWKLEDVTKLDVTDAVKKSSTVDFDTIMMLRDDNGKWALFLKPENENGYAVYPDNKDINTFFSLIKNPGNKTDAFRIEMAQKYHALTGTHPELKIDLFKSNATKEDLDRIERVNIFKTKADQSKVLCIPVIKGVDKVSARVVSHDQWQRMWLAPDMMEYKKNLAASLFADVLRQSRSDAVAVGTDKTEQESQSQTTQETKQVVAEHKEEQEHQESHEESEAHEKKEEEKKRQNSPEQKKKEQEEEKRKEELTKAETKAVAAIALSPILSQFKSIKEKHPDAMLLFRRGDFYETYMDDAEKSSRILGITLTKSSKEKDLDGKPLKIAGFPHHALDSYLPKLIRAGQRVAICDLLESPKQKVSEVVTPNKDPDSVPSQKQAVKAEEVQSHGLHR